MADGFLALGDIQPKRKTQNQPEEGWAISGYLVVDTALMPWLQYMC